MIGLALGVSVALAAGTAWADMQPIPNPPEKPKATAKHHAKKHHKAAKKAEKKADKDDKAATNATEPKK